MQTEPSSFNVRPADESDRDWVQGLLDGASWQHRHLDWARPMELLGKQPFVIADQAGLPVGLLACPPDPPGVAWIRLLAVASGYPLIQIWQELWQRARAMLKDLAIDQAAVLVIPAWLPPLLENVGFSKQDSVRFMEWSQPKPPMEPEHDLPIEPLLSTNLTAVVELDARAFDPLWRHSREALSSALDHANYATVLRRQGEIIGYQISTLSEYGAHLARLAIDPEHQRQGLASYLVSDVIRHFVKRGHERLTVNTQGSNKRSQALYRGLGFEDLNQEFPVYAIQLTNK